MTISVVCFGYAEQLPDGMGFYKHPDGGSCALTCIGIYDFDDEEAAFEYGIAKENQKYVHSVMVTEK